MLTRSLGIVVVGGVLAWLAACKSTTTCCVESVGITYGLIYGVVRSADGAGVAGAQIHSTVQSDTATSLSGGAYRLPLSFPLFAPGPRQATVNVFPPSYRPGVDSILSVSFTVESFATQAVGDSTRVDITLVGAR